MKTKINIIKFEVRTPMLNKVFEIPIEINRLRIHGFIPFSTFPIGPKLQ
jgi:hypothetical protein